MIVDSRNERTRINIEERLSGLAVGLGVGIGALGSALFAIAVPIASLSGAILLSRTIFRSAVRRRQRVLRELLDQLTEDVESAARVESGPAQQQLPGT